MSNPKARQRIPLWLNSDMVLGCQVQLAVAVSGLAEGRPVSSIARSLGYLPSSFSDMFRRELGAAPTEFDPQETLSAARAETGAQAGG